MEEETVNQAEKLKSVCSRGLIFQQTPSVRCILSLYPEIDHKNISFIVTSIRFLHPEWEVWRFTITLNGSTIVYSTPPKKRKNWYSQWRNSKIKHFERTLNAKQRPSSDNLWKYTCPKITMKYEIFKMMTFFCVGGVWGCRPRPSVCPVNVVITECNNILKAFLHFYLKYFHLDITYVRLNKY